jgi:hypothetical protein
MEIQVALDEPFRIEASSIHYGDRFAHRRESVFVRALRGQGRDFRLEDLSYFYKMNGAFVRTAAHHTIQGVAHRTSASIGDECAAPGEGLDQPLFAQRLHGFANRRAAYAKLLRELSLGRQLFALLQVTVGNRVFDLFDDLFVQT